MEIQAELDPQGNPHVKVQKLSPEQMEILKVLHESGAWRLYRQMLITAKEGYFHAALAMNDSNQIMKTIGTVAGINFAVNQLGVLMAQYQKSAKSVEGETRNHPQAQG